MLPPFSLQPLSVPVPSQSLTFGAGKPGARFADLKNTADPQAKRTFSLRNALFALTAFSGFWYGTAVVNNLHERAQARVEQSKPAETTADQVLNVLAHTDVAIQKTPVAGTLQDWYVILLTWQSLALGLAATGAVYKRSIRPGDLHAELNRRGLTGEGIKVAVLDTGAIATGALKKDKLTVYDPNDLEKKIPPKDGTIYAHGTGVAHLIAEACPGASISAFPMTPKGLKTSEAVQKVFQEGRQDPASLTPDKLRQADAPFIQHLANCVKKAADDGHQVINVSLNPEQALDILPTIEAEKNLLGSLGLRLRKPFAGVAAQEKIQQALEARKAYREALGEITKDRQLTPTDDPALQALYRPWVEALDYAHTKGVAVVVASGSSGGHTVNKPNTMGNVNPLAMVDHPALITVGSTDSEGTISRFTSEFNGDIRPLIAANGSGELPTAYGSSAVWYKALMPLGALHKRLLDNHAKGTAFAAPDVAALYAKMKQLDPSLTVEEAKAIMAEAASDAQFSWLHKSIIEKEFSSQYESNPEFETLLEGLVEEILTAKPGKQLHAQGENETWRIEVTAKDQDLEISLTQKNLKQNIQVNAKGALAEGMPPEEKMAVILPVLQRLISSRLSPALSPVEEKMAEEMARRVGQGAMARRVGHGTLANRRQHTIALTEERALQKAAKES